MTAATSPGPAVRIGLFGQFGSGNSGNDGSLAAMLEFLRQARPDAELCCVCSDPVRVERDHAVRAVRIHCGDLTGRLARSLDAALLGAPRRLANWVQAIRETRRFDVVIVPGTGILDDFQERPMGWPYTLFRWCVAAWLAGARIAFVSIGAGPIEHRLSRWFMTRSAGLARYRSYRDEASKRFMQDIGFDAGDDPVYPDLVFGAATPPRAIAPLADGGALTVGVGVMAYSGWHKGDARGAAICEEYLSGISRFIVWLLDGGYGVRLLTGDERDGEAIDRVLARPEVAGHPAAAGIVAEPTSSLTELMRQIAGTDVVVATRFHNVVCALKLGVPTVSISYAQKNDVLLGEMGLGEFCQPIERLDVDLLIEQFRKVVATRDERRAEILTVDRIFRERLVEQEMNLSRKILMTESSGKVDSGRRR